MHPSASDVIRLRLQSAKRPLRCEYTSVIVGSKTTRTLVKLLIQVTREIYCDPMIPSPPLRNLAKSNRCLNSDSIVLPRVPQVLLPAILNRPLHLSVRTWIGPKVPKFRLALCDPITFRKTTCRLIRLRSQSVPTKMPLPIIRRSTRPFPPTT